MECFVILQDISKKTLALVWLYLQINGKPNEKLLNEQTMWTFDRDDFKSAITCLILDDEDEMDKTELQMKELISKHFEKDKQLTDWSKDIYKQVTMNYSNIFSLKNYSLKKICFNLTSACSIPSKRLPLCVSCG